MRIYRTTWLAAAVSIGVCVVLLMFTTQARDDNEQRLLDLRAAEVSSLLSQMVQGMRTDLASVVAIAGATDGDPAQFAASVDHTAYNDSGSTRWALLRRGADGGPPTVVATAGAEPIDGEGIEADPHVFDAAFDGEFLVLGFEGGLFNRSIGVAAGARDGNGYVVYAEMPLLGGTTGGSAPAADEESTGGEVLADLDFALYLGEPTSENFVFGLGTPSGRVAQVQSAAGSATITVVVSANHPLAGALAHDLPWILFGGGLVTSVGGLWIIQHTLRRRDDAVAVAAVLSEKNEELDQALLAREEADLARDRAEGELRQAQRLDAVGQLAGGIAHDFNNLLAAILSYADLVAGDLGQEHPSRVDIDEIRGAARRGAGLTRKLLQFSREAPTVTEQVDVDEVVAGVVRLLRRTIGEEVTVELDLAGDLPPVIADALGLEQVVMNLVVNSRDAIDGAGEIFLRTDVVTVREGDYQLLRPGPHVRLRVSDTGVGMDAGTARRAFEPFFTTKSRGRGTGLGLATVYGIVQKAGGHITVSSEPGVGTEFEILLPVAPATEDADGGAAPAGDPRPCAGRVLVVEDEEAVLRAACRMLERAGYHVRSAPDGATALREHAGADDIDLLLTDVILPGGRSGAEVADEMRRLRPDLPVIFMSGYSADILAERGVGSDHEPRLLAKPFSEQDLLGAVGAALAEARFA